MSGSPPHVLHISASLKYPREYMLITSMQAGVQGSVQGNVFSLAWKVNIILTLSNIKNTMLMIYIDNPKNCWISLWFASMQLWPDQMANQQQPLRRERRDAQHNLSLWPKII